MGAGTRLRSWKRAASSLNFGAFFLATLHSRQAVAQAGLEPTVQIRMTLNSPSSWLSFLKYKITGTCYNVRVCLFISVLWGFVLVLFFIFTAK